MINLAPKNKDVATVLRATHQQQDRVPRQAMHLHDIHDIDQRIVPVLGQRFRVRPGFVESLNRL